MGNAKTVSLRKKEQKTRPIPVKLGGCSLHISCERGKEASRKVLKLGGALSDLYERGKRGTERRNMRGKRSLELSSEGNVTHSITSRADRGTRHASVESEG